jgi:uncharacterized membrane protein
VIYLFYDRSSGELHKFGQEGIISLCLTIVNIVMIIISSMIMFRLKEVKFRQLFDVISEDIPFAKDKCTCHILTSGTHLYMFIIISIQLFSEVAN